MLKFTLFGIPVGVHFSFLLIGLLAYPQLRGAEVGAWIVAVFVAVLLHEAGHAFTARGFGAGPVTITLFALGGVTMYPADGRLSAWQRFAISAAGSGVGIVAGGAVWLLLDAGVFDSAGRLFRIGVGSFIFASLIWGVLNWLPIKPLDGSHMVRSALDAVAPSRAASISWAVSLVAGVGAVVAALAFRQYFAAMFAAFLTLSGLRREPATAERHPAELPPADEGDPAEAPAGTSATIAESEGVAPATPDPEASTTGEAPPDPPTFPI